MPIPKPKGGEKESEFIGRCMSAISGEDKPQEQKLAICYRTWRDAKGKAATKARRLDVAKAAMSASDLDRMSELKRQIEEGMAKIDPKFDYRALAHKNGVDWASLLAGTIEETEHTDSLEEAAGIALDHLAERSDYYHRLEEAGLMGENE